MDLRSGKGFWQAANYTVLGGQVEAAEAAEAGEENCVLHESREAC